jgi:hypothetical protein
MSKRRIVKISCWIVGILVGVGLLMPVQVHTRTRHTCLLCRQERTDYRLCGYNWQSSHTNEFSAWYDSHLPAHAHIWERSSCTRGWNIFGQTVSWSCPRIHPIGLLPPRTELEFAERADEAALTAFFENIRSPDRETQRRAVDGVWESEFVGK